VFRPLRHAAAGVRSSRSCQPEVNVNSPIGCPLSDTRTVCGGSAAFSIGITRRRIARSRVLQRGKVTDERVPTAQRKPSGIAQPGSRKRFSAAARSMTKFSPVAASNARHSGGPPRSRRKSPA